MELLISLLSSDCDYNHINIISSGLTICQIDPIRRGEEGGRTEERGGGGGGRGIVTSAAEEREEEIGRAIQVAV